MEIIFNRINRNVRINRWVPARTTSDLISSVSSNLLKPLLKCFVKTLFYNKAINQKKKNLKYGFSKMSLKYIYDKKECSYMFFSVLQVMETKVKGEGDTDSRE